MRKEIVVNEENYFNRLDKFLRKNFDELKMASLYKLLRKGDVKVNGSREKKPGFSIEVGDRISVWLPEKKEKRIKMKRSFEGKRKLKPVKMPLEILHEDEDILVINKAPGISVHPGKGEKNRATLIEGLMAYGEKNGFEPYLVHRLDRDTSGVLIISKSRPLTRTLTAQIAKRGVYKEYSALCVGNVDQPVTINASIDEKEALTKLTPVADYRFVSSEKEIPFTLLSVVIETGRKHQIRRHLAQIKQPIAGDDKYGNREVNRLIRGDGLKRPFLHCSRMIVQIPGGKKYDLRAFRTQDLEDFLSSLRRV